MRGIVFDITPETHDEIIDGARIGVFVQAPHFIEHALAGNRLSFVLDQIFQDIQFHQCERKHLVAHAQFERGEIDGLAAEFERSGGFDRWGGRVADRPDQPLPAAQLLCAFADFFAAAAIESSRGGSVLSLTDPGVLRTVAGSSLYLTVVVIIGLALGALLRKTAAGLSVFAAVFFVIPVTVGALPQNIRGFAPYLPSNAGGALWGSPLGSAQALSPWTGFACLCGYAVALTVLAAWQLRRRDA